MEDAHTHLLSVPDDNKAAFFAVYDGHGGAKVSQYAGTNLHKTIATNSSYCAFCSYSPISFRVIVFVSYPINAFFCCIPI
ncbi:unnamed protein product [Anisakis simplex]|uniref:Probable protein phosphatase 2C (inferred by orthology to a C. elegans protein) n=1 Tax=Anisakis simplex TaxID=6269 RepID=A0A0M3JPQ4_ANISI|nr:unnamed protein product [Anisakis simplex]